MDQDTLNTALDSAVSSGDLLPSSAGNIRALLSSSANPVYHASVEELVESKNWKELDNRFYMRLAFGTGGLRGRTIGRVVTRAEMGTPQLNERPEFPCVGTCSMNTYNINRATRGLIAYVKQWMAEEKIAGKPRLVFCHDTRHFSRDFAELCARIAKDLGCDVFLFDSHRATPEWSFALRHLNAHAGVMLTASHNPAHDNGYKVNFADGAAIVSPQTDGIIAEVNAIAGEEYEPLPEGEQGSITIIGPDIDPIYIERLKGTILQPELLERKSNLKIVFTALHGAGGVLAPRILRELNFDVLTVPEQDTPDGRFPTVESPNPENAPALKMAVDLAEKEHADIVMGTDPDCDRMGVVARDSSGKMVLLTGNQIGSILAYYRLKIHFEKGILTEQNKDHAVLIKTFVTTNLQRAIADHYGVRCLDTLTGFKYIGQKLRKYEDAVLAKVDVDYRSLSEPETRALRLQYSTYFVFGGEESYGYLACDFTRDKDANGAVAIFAETAAYALSRGMTVIDLLDEIYTTFGYYLEKNTSKTFEGAEGAGKIKQLAASYADNPPTEVDGAAVTKVRDFAKGGFFDEEGDPIPKEKMLFVDLADGRTFAVRPSGTEPKIKYYLFARRDPADFTADTLPQVKTDTAASLDRLWVWLQTDIDARLKV
jgi:phosphoglucomutase